MRILLWSNSFHPIIGGLEAVSRTLAEEFVSQGHQVTLITRTPFAAKDEFSFAVVRQPGWLQVLRLVKECDVYFHNHISLKAAWPLFFVRRPWVVAHHTWIPRSGISGFIKHTSLRYARSISCSNEIASHVKHPSTVIFSPYDDRIFYERPELPREKDLIFVGRLGREKGAHILLDALLLLKAAGYIPTLTIVGGGPEREPLGRQAHDLGIAGQVNFVGPKDPPEIAVLLSQHRMLVVPSIREPFGIVALEGIACGCVVVGSDAGGLKDAIGRCGITFSNEDSSALASCLAGQLLEPETTRKYQDRVDSHLQSCTRSVAADSYLSVLRCAYAAAKT